LAPRARLRASGAWHDHHGSVPARPAGRGGDASPTVAPPFGGRHPMRLHHGLPVIAPALLSLLLASAAPAATAPRPLLREGDAAFARGDHARAADLYEQAEVRASDPERVAFHLASAKYHLAEAEDSPSSPALREAEQLYRCCLGPASPWRA